MGTRSRHGLEHAHVDGKLHEHTVHTVRARRRARRGHTKRWPALRAQRGHARSAQGTHGRTWCMCAAAASLPRTADPCPLFPRAQALPGARAALGRQQQQRGLGERPWCRGCAAVQPAGAPPRLLRGSILFALLIPGVDYSVADAPGVAHRHTHQPRTHRHAHARGYARTHAHTQWHVMQHQAGPIHARTRARDAAGARDACASRIWIQHGTFGLSRRKDAGRSVALFNLALSSASSCRCA